MPSRAPIKPVLQSSTNNIGALAIASWLGRMRLSQGGNDRAAGRNSAYTDFIGLNVRVGSRAEVGCLLFLNGRHSSSDCSLPLSAAGHHELPASTQPRRAASIATTSIFLIVIIASNARLASSPPAAMASVSTRGVICHETPHLSLPQPQALSWPPLPTTAFQ